MPRKKLSVDERKEILTIWIEGKHLKGQNKDELRAVAHKSIVKHVEHQTNKNNS